MGLLDFNDPDSLSQLGMAFGLLNARRGDNWPQLLVQAAQAKEAQKQKALQQQLLQQQLQGGGLDLKMKQQQFDDTNRARDLLRGMGGQPPEGVPQSSYRPAPAPGGGSMAMPVPSASQNPAVGAPGPTGSGKNQTFAYYSSLAQKMMQNGLPDQAQKYLDLAEKFRPKLKDTKTLTDPNSGQRVTVNFYEDGTREVVPFGPDQEKAHFADTGGAIAALDPFTGKPLGNGVAKTVSPDTQFTGGVTMRGQNLTDAREKQGLGIRAAELAYNTGLGANNYAFPTPNVPGANLSGMAPAARSQVATDVAKKGGEMVQQARTDLPNVEAQTQQTIKLVDELVNHPGFSGSVGAKSPFGALAAMGHPVPGTDTADFVARRNQIVGQQFMQAYQNLKGGGQITEVEGKKATEAISRMETSQSEDEFKRAAQDFKQVMQAGLMRARAKASGTVTGFRILGKE